MGWIAGILALGLLVILAGFRKFVLWVVMLVGGVGYLTYLERQQQEEASFSRISRSELGFDDVTLKPDFSGFRLAGRVTNRSPFMLKQVWLVVTVRDCKDATQQSSCIIIGESSESMYFDVPPGQTHVFSESVHFAGPLNVKGHLVWDYSISQIKGK